MCILFGREKYLMTYDYYSRDKKVVKFFNLFDYLQVFMYLREIYYVIKLNVQLLKYFSLDVKESINEET